MRRIVCALNMIGRPGRPSKQIYILIIHVSVRWMLLCLWDCGSRHRCSLVDLRKCYAARLIISIFLSEQLFAQWRIDEKSLYGFYVKFDDVRVKRKSKSALPFACSVMHATMKKIIVRFSVKFDDVRVKRKSLNRCVTKYLFRQKYWDDEPGGIAFS